MVPPGVGLHGVCVLHARRTIGWDGVKGRSQIMLRLARSCPSVRRDKDVSLRAYISHRHLRPQLSARSSRSFSSTTTIPSASHYASTMAAPVYVSSAPACLSFRSDRHEFQRRHWPHRFGRHGASSRRQAYTCPQLACTQGQNLILNMNDKGFTVVAYNRTTSKVDHFLANEAKGAFDLAELVRIRLRPLPPTCRHQGRWRLVDRGALRQAQASPQDHSPGQGWPCRRRVHRAAPSPSRAWRHHH